jgi:hypothetical protein
MAHQSLIINPFEHERSVHPSDFVTPHGLNFGRIEDPDHVEQFVASQPFGNLAQAAPDFIGSSNDMEVFFWEAEELVTNTVRPPHNQARAGSCTSQGVSGGLEDLQFIRIGWRGFAEEFKWVLSEFLYGGGRQDIGRGRFRTEHLGRPDGGCVTSYVVQYAIEKGFLPRGKYTFGGREVDLTTYTDINSVYFGNNGVPSELLELQHEHLLLGSIRPNSADEACDMMRHGIPIVAGSSQGFTTVRDSDGFCRPGPRWDHCTYFRGFVKTGKRPGVVYQQSWGPNMPSGPRQIVVPSGRTITLPEGAFFVDMDVFEHRIVAARDIHGLVDMSGFATLDYKFW